MQYFTNPSERLEKALAALTTDPDGKLVIEYLSQNAAALMKRSCQEVNDTQCRKYQGAAIALTELVDLIEQMSKKMRG